jgi:hypothetical protein
MSKALKKQSRTNRWMEAASKAVSALEELVELQEEYSEWFDNMNENLQNGATGEKLQALIDLDLSSALDTAQEAEGAELPLGFGRD